MRFLAIWIIGLTVLALDVAGATMAMSDFIRGYHIPDPERPIPKDERGMVGPSGELIPFLPDRIQEATIVGRQVDEFSPYLGTYGIGGPGFLGLRLGNEWLTVAIWSAGEWITVDDLLVADAFYENHKRPEPWIRNRGDRLSSKIVGSTIEAVSIRPFSLKLKFGNGQLMSIDRSSDYRPIYEGSKEPRVFIDVDDLRDVVFLSPTAEIWID